MKYDMAFRQNTAERGVASCTAEWTECSLVTSCRGHMLLNPLWIYVEMNDTPPHVVRLLAVKLISIELTHTPDAPGVWGPANETHWSTFSRITHCSFNWTKQCNVMWFFFKEALADNSKHQTYSRKKKKESLSVQAAPHVTLYVQYAVY